MKEGVPRLEGGYGKGEETGDRRRGKGLGTGLGWRYLGVMRRLSDENALSVFRMLNNIIPGCRDKGLADQTPGRVRG